MESSRAASVINWHRRQRWLVLALAAAAAAMFAGSYFLPWWDFTLVAPQYPKGLSLVISLTGVTGDVDEINIINHYIGMGHLEDAATLERAYAGWLIGGIGVAVLAATLLVGRKLNPLPALLAATLPLGFIGDTMYWLYRFGHDLDPKAPVHIQAFTPTLFGHGKVGQFETMAVPGWGFWLATLGVILVVVAIWQRRKVCADCPAHEVCETLCEHGLVKAP